MKADRWKHLTSDPPTTGSCGDRGVTDNLIVGHVALRQVSHAGRGRTMERRRCQSATLHTRSHYPASDAYTRPVKRRCAQDGELTRTYRHIRDSTQRLATRQLPADATQTRCWAGAATPAQRDTHPGSGPS
jgi:hypothetical protein